MGTIVIGLLSIPGKAYGKVIIGSVQRLTEEETRRLQEGKGMCGSESFLQDGG